MTSLKMSEFIEARRLIKELSILTERAKTTGHNFAKSFADHPKGCVYCGTKNKKG